MGEEKRRLWSEYWCQINGIEIDPAWLRQTPPGEPRLPDLVGPGDVVVTSYGTGPFKAEEVVEHQVEGVPCWTLVCRDQRDNRKAWLNELTAVGGELVKLMPDNLDRVVVTERRPGLQLALFGGGHAA